MSEQKSPTKVPGILQHNVIAMFTAVVAAFAASLCCVGPVVFMILGIGGSWMSNLMVFEPYRPVFIFVTLVFVFLAFRKLYLIPRRSANDKNYKISAKLKNQRILFWLINLVLIALISFPYYGFIFF